MKDLKSVKNELQNIISGKSNSGQSNTIQATKTYLRNCKETSGKAKGTKPERAEEERALKEYAGSNQLLIKKEDIGTYITSGAEQKIFYKENDTIVYKIVNKHSTIP